MPEHYFIDGYNVLHRSRALRKLASKDLEAARDQLVDTLAQFCATSGVPTTLVFDGRGSRSERAAGPLGVGSFEIVYAPEKQSADAFIERAIYQASNRRDLVVVSGDRGITDLCMGMGALAMTPETFLATIRDRTQQVRQKAERDAPVGNLGRVEDQLDDASRARLDEWKRRLAADD